MKQSKKTRLLGKILFVLYLAFVIYFLLFSDWYGRSGTFQEYHYNLELFKEIKRFWYYRNQVGLLSVGMNIVGNVVIFIPLGFFLPMASRGRSLFLTVFYGFGLSLLVESFQLLTKVGSFDVDDLLLNTAGSLLGYLLFMVCAAIRRKNVRSKKNKNRKR